MPDVTETVLIRSYVVNVNDAGRSADSALVMIGPE